MSSRRTVIGVMIGLVSVCLCSFALIAGAGALFYYAADGVAALQTPAPPVRATPAAPRDPRWTPEPAPTPGPTEIAEMDAIQQQVIQRRGLQPIGPVERKFLTVDEVKQRTLDDFNKDTSPEEWQANARSLAALGLIAPHLDLHALFVRLYSEGVAGFYDPDTKELVLVSETGLNAYEKTVFAHEYNHALQDQSYDIRGLGFSEEGWDTDSERAAAVQALLEGDSSLLEEQYKATLSPAEQREYDQALKSLDVSVYFGLPDYLLHDFFFPYSQGLDFVRRYYDEGGWARVDKVWNNPPVSTEQILHPERYEAGDAPLIVARPALTDTLGAGWRQAESGVIGEWYTYLILAYGVRSETRLPAHTAYQAAEGWGGDGYTVFYKADTDQIVLALQWDWDDLSEADQFVRAFNAYGDKRFGSAQASANNHACWIADEINCFYFNGLHTLWIMAPEQATVDAVLSRYPDFKDEG